MTPTASGMPALSGPSLSPEQQTQLNRNLYSLLGARDTAFRNMGAASPMITEVMSTTTCYQVNSVYIVVRIYSPANLDKLNLVAMNEHAMRVPKPLLEYSSC